MAETIGEFFVRLGLDSSVLEEGIASAERTLKQEMARLNRQNTLINLRAQVEIAGLDETTDAERILEIQMEALNQQIANQRQRVELANAAISEMTRLHGANSVETQRAQIAYERERLTLVRLEQQLQNLNDTTETANEENQSLIDKMKAITEKAGPLVAGIMSVAGALSAAYEITNDLVESFRELQNQSLDLNMSISDTDNFVKQIRLAGGDLEDAMGYIRGMTDAFVKGEVDDPEFIALSKYNAEIIDATGRLKNFKEIFEETYQAFKKADAAGEAIEFLQLTGGESGVTDVIKLFRRWEEANEDLNRIVGAELDLQQLHEAERAFNRLTIQIEEFAATLEDIITPATKVGVEQLFEVIAEGTRIINENKTDLQEWGFVVKELLADMADIVTLDYSSYLKRNFNEGGFIQRAQKALAQYNEELENTASKYEELEETLNDDKNPLSQYAIQRIGQFNDEIEAIRDEIEYFGDEYQKARAEIMRWQRNELENKLFLSTDEETAIRKLGAAKLELLEKQHLDELNKIREDSLDRAAEMLQEAADIQFNMVHNEIERELRDIERWKQAQLEKAETAEETAAVISNVAMKEAEIFKREMDRIQGNVESAQDRLMRLTQSQRDIDMHDATKRYMEDIEGGLPKDFAKTILEVERLKINKTADEQRDSYLRKPLDLPNNLMQKVEYYLKQMPEKLSMQSPDYVNALNANQQLQWQAYLAPKLDNIGVDINSLAQELPPNVAEMTAAVTDLNRTLYEKISEMTASFGEMAQGINDTYNQRQTTTVAPVVNLNIDLGGAYVFDNSMKQQLVDDITTDVANAVTDAVKNAAGQASYGYGN